MSRPDLLFCSDPLERICNDVVLQQQQQQQKNYSIISSTIKLEMNDD